MRRIGERFVLDREIGSGGMSTVFLGHDEVLDRPVAVKILKPGFEGSETGARFRREGITAARLSHPNIVQVYDAGEDELDGRGVSYIVMEYVSGGDLKNLIDEKGPLGETELSRIGADVVSGLAHAHNRGIIHRDIKPHNVLIDEYGRPRVADFGIARALDSATSHATKTGSYLGTALYSAPEQLKGEKATPKSDVYSLGATLYHAGTGEPPFSGSSIEVASQHVSTAPVPMRERGASVSEAFDNLILQCLAKDPGSRPEAGDLHSRLLQRGAASGTAAAPADGTSPDLEPLKAAGAAGVAAAARAARQAREAGAAGFDAAAGRVRDSFGQRGSEGHSGIPTRTVIVPHRTFRPGANRLTALMLGIAALLVVALISWMAVAMLGSGSTEQSGKSDSSKASPKKSAETGASASVKDKKAADSKQQTQQKKESAPKKPVQGKSAEKESPEKARVPAPPVDQAANVVYDMYVSTVNNDFSASWNSLSRRYQEQVGTEQDWERRQSSLAGIHFPGSLTAKPDGDKAKVDFTAQETRADGTKTVTGTWICVNENGRWKLDRLVTGSH